VGKNALKCGFVSLCLSLGLIFLDGWGTAGANPSTAASANPQTWTISGSVSPPASAAGTTLTLQGPSSATTSPDTSGNYSFTGLANGSYTITPAKSGVTFSPASQSIAINGASQSGVNFTINAAAGPTLQSITITATSASIAKGTSDQFTATGTFSDGSTQNLTNSVTWNSSSTTNASINPSGLATGLAAGSSNITASQSGVNSNTFVLNVTAAVLRTITINGVSASIAKGTTDQFTATGTFSDGSTQNLTNSVTWSSSNTATATISAAGLAAGLAVGTTNITAVQGGVTSNVLALSVTSATLKSISISAAGLSIAVGTSDQFTATGTFSDGTTQNFTTTVAWNSSNAAVATISSSGLATAIAIGSASISAT